ncbi:hypothetical protein O0L34_g13698 [Tuta absoluta]|nr:hypothetical protein O0L34_g13698 [Tuta absoluta]
MDVVGSEIGQKMRSAIKAKLTELGCYVDDELPDYVMVMVANKRTRAQMEEDLQLFLGDNTELFVNWLHQVLKKLQEVTVPAPKEPEKVKEKKEKKSKDKDKTKSGKKTDSVKKSKKKDKIKEKLRKKEEKKAHKSKKKSKHHDIIRPNVPPLLMNMEKDSEPSITDVFAGQILKNHGVIIDTPKEEKVEQKPVIKDVKRPILPIIDPATISQPEAEVVDISTEPQSIPQDGNEVPGAAPREEQIKEINEIEAKIQGLKQKLAEQLDSMSDDEDFLNIRTEAEELMNDFAEDVFQEISSQAQPVATPPVVPEKSPSPPPIPKNVESVDLEKNPPDDTSMSDPPKAQEPEVLPQIELKLPKRPVRERLGAREQKKIVEVEPRGKESSAIRERKRTESPERFTPDREPDFWGNHKSSAKSRLGEAPEPIRRSPVTVRRSPITVRRSPISIRKSPVKDTKRNAFSTDSESDAEKEGRRKERKRRDSSSSPERPRVSCASVVRVRPRPRVAPSSSLLMRAVADAHKSLLNIPPKVETEPSKIKRALVHPMRRGDPQNIVIHVPSEREDKLVLRILDNL